VKKLIIYLLYALCVVLLVHYFVKKHSSSSHQQQPAAVQESQSQQAPTLPAKKKKTPVELKSAVTKHPATPDVQPRNPTQSNLGNFVSTVPDKHKTLQSQIRPNHVLFEIKMKDWAVAFGDVLLGKLTKPLPSKTAQYKPKNPLLWPTADIPFAIDPDCPNADLIMASLQYFNENTPIRFVQIQNQKDGIVFVRGDSNCYSYLGHVGRIQPVFLSDKCGEREILHEVMHALGFIHEQSRTDRNQYVEIEWDNIQPDFQLQFLKAPKSYMVATGATVFDYNSVMLYRPNAFAKSPSLESMRSLTDSKIKPSEQGLSSGDLNRLYKVYGQEE